MRLLRWLLLALLLCAAVVEPEANRPAKAGLGRQAMKSTIRQWNPDAGTYGDVLLTLHAPDTGNPAMDEYELWDATTHVAPLMGKAVAVFYDDDTAPTHHYNGAWQSRRVA